MITVVFCSLPLAGLLRLHSSILKPYLDLSLREIKIPCQFPSFLLWDVGIEEELLLQLESLKLRVWFPLLANRDMTSMTNGKRSWWRCWSRCRSRNWRPIHAWSVNGMTGIACKEMMVKNCCMMMMVMNGCCQSYISCWVKGNVKGNKSHIRGQDYSSGGHAAGLAKWTPKSISETTN